MSRLAELERHTTELSTAVKILASFPCQLHNQPQLQPSLADVAEPDGVRRARAIILSSVNKLASLVSEPTDLLRNLATQVYICHSGA